MQLIAADIGNSSTKIAVDHAGHDDRWSTNIAFRDNDPIGDDFSPVEQSKPAYWSISSVSNSRLNQLHDWVKLHRPSDIFHVIEPSEVELETDVQSREQLGRDRLIAAWMAVQLDDSAPIIVIDAGTAVTIDYVDAKGVFQGGVIFPGAESNFRQLCEHTDALPNLDRSHRNSSTFLEPIGKSTNDAIVKGVFYAQVAAIIGIVNHLSLISHDQAHVYVTGGGSIDLIEMLPENWNDVPDLVLRGAKSIGAKLIKQLGDKVD